MRNFILGGLCSAALLLTACDLDKYPQGSISTGTAWVTINDARNFRMGVYSYLQVVNGGIHVYTSDYQSDLFNATVSFGNRGGDMHRWDFTNSQYDIEDIYRYNYTCINNCNNIIENIDKIATDDEAERNEADNIKGEAYLIRAMCYHTLAVRFAKDYEPGTAESVPGLPLVETVDPNAKPSRATLKATYDFIKEDIRQARTLINEAGKANAIFLTKDAIDAFEARVDLYMHRYQEAYTLAKKIIEKYPLATSTEELKSMLLNDEGSEVIFCVDMTSDDRSNPFTYYLNWNTGNKHFSPDFIPSQWVIDLYEDEDIRKEAYFLKETIQCNEIVAEGIYILNKYPGNPALKQSEYEYYNKAKPFRAAEAYLIAAEASYRENDANGALGYLNSLRKKRGASELNAGGEALLDAIKKEWIREFVGEGMRLNDLKRWNDGFTRHEPQDKKILLVGTGMETLSIQAGNQRFVWEIPANDLNANKNLVPNWNE